MELNIKISRLKKWKIREFKLYNILLITLGCLNIQPVLGQTNSIDSVSTLSYMQLIQRIQSTEANWEREIYGNAFLKKAKLESDLDKILGGYEILSSVNKGEDAIKYYDSIIDLTRENPDSFYPASAYLGKAREYYQARQFKPALDYYLRCFHLSHEYENSQLKAESGYGIGILKSRMGSYKEAIDLHRQNLKYFASNVNVLNNEMELATLFSLAADYHRLEKNDSAAYYTSTGLLKSGDYNNQDYKNYFNMSRGILDLKNKNYKEAGFYLKKSTNYMKKIEDIPNLIFGYYYLGKLEADLGKQKNAVTYFKKVDSLFTISNDIHPEVRYTYEYLIENSQINDNLEKQLEYLNKLLKIDSLLNSNKIYLIDNIKFKYDKAVLLEEKEKVITKLGKEKSIITFLLFFVVAVVLLLIANSWRKQNYYKRKFQELIAESNSETKALRSEKHNNLQLPKEVVNEVIIKLNKFEDNHEFIEQSISLNSLAKRFDTNATYLSKIINVLKSKSFSTYLNDLRIDFSIQEIKENPNKYRKYTISAISDQMGFKSPETFSKHFKKKTGIYPSYFIKQILKSGT